MDKFLPIGDFKIYSSNDDGSGDGACSATGNGGYGHTVEYGCGFMHIKANGLGYSINHCKGEGDGSGFATGDGRGYSH